MEANKFDVTNQEALRALYLCARTYDDDPENLDGPTLTNGVYTPDDYQGVTIELKTYPLSEPDERGIRHLATLTELIGDDAAVEHKIWRDEISKELGWQSADPDSVKRMLGYFSLPECISDFVKTPA